MFDAKTYLMNMLTKTNQTISLDDAIDLICLYKKSMLASELIDDFISNININDRLTDYNVTHSEKCDVVLTQPVTKSTPTLIFDPYLWLPGLRFKVEETG